MEKNRVFRIYDGTTMTSVTPFQNEKEVTVDISINKTDINNKPIFENDIIYVRNWGRTNEILCIAKVVWDSDDLCWNWVSETGNWSSCDLGEIDMYDRWRNVEIISNIHERPDLFKETS